MSTNIPVDRNANIQNFSITFVRTLELSTLNIYVYTTPNKTLPYKVSPFEKNKVTNSES